MWGFHVIEEDFDATFGGVAHDLDLMPAIGPGDRLGVLGNGTTWGVLNDHDLTASGVWLGPEVGVVEVGGVLMIEDDAAVAMVAGVLGAADFEGEGKVSDGEIFEQSDVEGAAVGGLVVALAAVDAEDGVAIHHPVRPAFFVGDFPVVAAFLKVFGEKQR